MLSSLSPQVVCTSTSSTVVTLSGSGLSALPTNAVSGTPGLAAPRVSLRRVAELVGTPVDGEAAIALDSPMSPGTTHERLVSDTSLQLILSPDLMLKSGIYSVDILSPSTPPNIKTATLEKALVIVPGLAVGKFSPAAACGAPTGQTITVKGDGFVVSGTTNPTVTFHPMSGGGADKTYELAQHPICTMVSGDINPPLALQICQELNFHIDQPDLMDGDYSVTFKNPPGVDCGATIVTSMYTQTPGPTVTVVKPTTMCATGARLTITGKNFAKGAVARLGGSTPIAPKVTMWVSETSVTADFTTANANMFGAPGTMLPVEVSNIDGCKGTLASAVTVLGGPDLAFSDTAAVANTINTPINLQANLIHGALGAGQLLPAGMAAGGMPMQVSIDPGHPSRIQAIVPRGLPAGLYDIKLTDSTTCPSIFPGAIKVIADGSLMVTGTDRPVGVAGARTPVTISGVGFLATPRLYLTAGGNSNAVAVPSVAVVSPTTLAVTFPALAAGSYDLVVVNGDGSVGTLPKAFSANAMPLPRIDSLSPATVAFGAMGAQPVVISGANFRSQGKAQPTVSMQCGQANLPNVPVLLQVADTQLKVDASAAAALPAGTTCTVRVTNGDDMGYSDFSSLAVSGAGGAVVNDTGGPSLATARRAPAVALVTLAGGRHSLLAIGGDNGMASGALDSVESVRVDGSGTRSGWAAQASKLPAPVTLAAALGIGRYVYLVGGNDGKSATSSVLRAALLDPAQAPVIKDVYLEPAMSGLAGGAYSYRVAGVLDMADPDNPGGETLASDPFVVFAPALNGMGIKASITWSAMAGAVSYRIYRSPMGDGGPEQLVGTSASLAFVDTGAATSAGTPVPAGSLTAWTKLPALSTPRESAALALAPDPVKAGTFYLYAIGGRDGMGKALASYEFLTLTVAVSGTQTVSPWTSGAKALAAPRYQASAFTQAQGGSTYVYVGGGTADGMNAVGAVEGGTVGGGGDLGVFTSAGAVLGTFGAAAASAPGLVLALGGNPPARAIQGATPGMVQPALTGFTNQAATMAFARYLAAAAVDGPILFVVGGSGMGAASATATTEWMVY